MRKITRLDMLILNLIGHQTRNVASTLQYYTVVFEEELYKTKFYFLPHSVQNLMKFLNVVKQITIVTYVWYIQENLWKNLSLRIAWIPTLNK